MLSSIACAPWPTLLSPWASEGDPFIDRGSPPTRPAVDADGHGHDAFLNPTLDRPCADASKVDNGLDADQRTGTVLLATPKSSVHSDALFLSASNALRCSSRKAEALSPLMALPVTNRAAAVETADSQFRAS